MTIALVTDSTCDLALQTLTQLDVRSVPLYVLFNGQTFKDGLEITCQDIFAGIKAGKKPPSTSQPSPAEFSAAYTQALERSEHVISLHLSSKLSGTVGSATLAAQDFVGRVTVVDSLTTAGGLALQVMRAREKISAGDDVHTIVETLERVKLKMALRFGVDTLEFLKLNGRIGGAQAMIGGLLGIKPLLKLENGRVEAASKVRGRSKMIEEIVNFFRSYVEQHGPSRVMYIFSEGGQESVAEIRSRVADLSPIDRGMLEAGAVIASHIGPGAVGVFLEPDQV